MVKRNPQLKLFKDSPKAYGGDLLKKRKGRIEGRPLDTRNTMHLVLRSTLALGDWSFRKPAHAAKIKELSQKFAAQNGIKILSLANVGNHLHFQIKLSNRFTYRPFIRALTAAIAMHVAGASRWNTFENALIMHKKSPEFTKLWEQSRESLEKLKKFWDCRPYTRVIIGWRSILNLRDYIDINKLEGFGQSRESARMILCQLDKRRREAG